MAQVMYKIAFFLQNMETGATRSVFATALLDEDDPWSGLRLDKVCPGERGDNEVQVTAAAIARYRRGWDDVTDVSSLHAALEREDGY